MRSAMAYFSYRAARVPSRFCTWSARMAGALRSAAETAITRSIAHATMVILVMAIYAVCASVLVYNNDLIPAHPSSNSPIKGVDISEAWIDLIELTQAFHPFNSQRSREVRKWLLARVYSVLDDNAVEYTIENGVGAVNDRKPATIVFDDTASNFTYYSKIRTFTDYAVYFEGTNVVVYVRGTEDSDDDWWREEGLPPPGASRGVLLTCHIDSAASSYGATDNSATCVSMIQLLQHFTTKGQQPKRGIVFLWDDGEEDGLNGAKAFTQLPIARFPDSFVNGEGSGAGGRSTLVRSTDAAVSASYGSVSRPYGNVVLADGYTAGAVRSYTDYDSHFGDLGLRGLDVVLVGSRAKYHTPSDATAAMSKNSLWHHLASLLEAVKALASDTDGFPEQTERAAAVYFDFLGLRMFVFSLRLVTGISVTLLIMGVAAFGFLAALLSRAAVSTSYKDLLSFPLTFSKATAAATTLVGAMVSQNLYIVYENAYPVWRYVAALTPGIVKAKCGQHLYVGMGLVILLFFIHDRSDSARLALSCVRFWMDRSWSLDCPRCRRLRSPHYWGGQRLFCCGVFCWRACCCAHVMCRASH